MKIEIEVYMECEGGEMLMYVKDAGNVDSFPFFKFIHFFV